MILLKSLKFEIWSNKFGQINLVSNFPIKELISEKSDDNPDKFVPSFNFLKTKVRNYPFEIFSGPISLFLDENIFLIILFSTSDFARSSITDDFGRYLVWKGYENNPIFQ